MVLESAGYSVITVGDGKADLEIFSSQYVNLVVLDYAMPEMTGCDVAVEMRRIRPEMPILMLSAYFPVPQITRRVSISSSANQPMQSWLNMTFIILYPRSVHSRGKL